MLSIIGGSGLYDLPGIKDVSEITPETPYGPPSGPVVRGRLGNVEICFLPRHGRGHRLNPSEVPYRANIHALKQLGATHLVSISAVGSLREHLPPGSMVMPDQVIDRTVGRDRTFFEDGVVAHVGLADPFCGSLQRHILTAADSLDLPISVGGTYVCIEGPQFSTRAESQLYRSWSADIIGMTAMPETRLAREAGLCYAIVATVSDFDVWHETEEDVSVQRVMQILAGNVERGKRLVSGLAGEGLPACHDGCASAPGSAIATDSAVIPAQRRELVELLTSRPSTTG